MKYKELKEKFHNKYKIRMIAGILTVALLGTGCGEAAATIANAENGNKVLTETQDVTEDAENAAQKVEELAGLSDKEVSAGGKEETVYLIADSKGNVGKTIVSEWLKNPEKSVSLTDASDLSDIKNVKGEETFEQQGDTIIWQADGKDIYYQGTTEKQAPISEKITYYLDGKEIEPEKLAGKSGKVTIRFDYTNNEKTIKTVNGKSYEVYVPFTAVTGMILGDNFKNVEVTNGKLVSDGKNNVVVGMAVPGLKESLQLDTEDFDKDVKLPEYVEVTADVEDFSLDMTMTLATNGLLGEIDEEGKFDLGALDKVFDEMTDAADHLEEGSSELADGMGTLKDSLGTFADGVGELKKGLKDYTNGVSKLGDGIDTLDQGAQTLTEGAKTIDSSAQSISDGVSKLDAMLNADLSEAEKQGITAKVNDIIASQKDAIMQSARASVETNEQFISKQAQDTVEKQFDNPENPSNYDNIKKAAAAEVKTQLSPLLSTGVSTYTDQVVTGISQSYYAVAMNEIIPLLVQTGISEEKAEILFNQYWGKISNDVMNVADSSLESAKSEMVSVLSENISGEVGITVADATKKGALDAAGQAAVAAAKETAGQSAYTGAIEAAKETALSTTKQTKQAVAAGIEAKDPATGYSLTTGAKALATGTGQMIGSLPTLTGGVKQLLNGAEKLVSNNDKLLNGADELANGTDQVADGVEQLKSGTDELADGMKTFNEEAIRKLAESYHSDVKSLLDRFDAVTMAGKDYQTFTKTAKGVEGSVKFILKTDAIK